MKDPARDRFPAYLPLWYRAFLRFRKTYRQTATRLAESAAAKRPLDPLLADGAAASHQDDGANPADALTKCAKWFEEDLQRPDVKAVADRILALKAELDARGLRSTNTAGNFLSREYHAASERGKLWENAWVIRHADLRPGQRVLDVGGASTLFSFYLASLGCEVAVVDNDWANCGTLFNATYVAKRMGWRLRALDRDVQRPLPFPDASLDRAFSICVLEHLPPRLRQGVMKEIGRVLKPGGIAGFTTDYDEVRPVLLTDKGLRFAYKSKLERDVIRPSGLELFGAAHWVDACSRESFLGAFFLAKPSR
ncbi:MAG: class I SAM-dependent methyltransferase [Candidatus Omnitrophica bacterium]|nr:class I SAM-dependent methyltransferase [Candidatus Omnitrophota bacterium]